ncbi:MAG TPA: type IV toxin-antitoxin system AbiEi family antitoxin domain-containing protein [Actinotalea sp.]|nr:type IV toxin-antitoxin system AbiEi family antitoxin domain-containing protein [Actinotalea sp.]
MTERQPRDWLPPDATRQSGVFTVRQAIAAGLTPAQARHRRETGTWRRVAGDGFALASAAVTPWVQVQAAALTWPDGVVGLSTAARLHGLPVPDDGVVHVIVPWRSRSRGALVSHRLELDPEDVVDAGIGRATGRRRTILDCLGRLPVPAAQGLLAWVATRDLLSTEDLAAAIALRPRTWGTTARREALDDLARGTLSRAERRLHAILRRGGVTGWAFNQQVRDAQGLIGRVDVLLAAARLVIEVDGFAFHDRGRFQADRTRQNRLVAAGYTVLRFTWADLTDRPAEVLRQVRAVTDAQGRGSGTDRSGIGSDRFQNPG